MDKNTSIILTYKNKILLFSKDDILNLEKTEWDFLNVGSLGKKSLSQFLRKVIDLPTDVNDSDIKLTHMSPQKEQFQILHFRLTDANVNSIIRKSGMRLEFYGFKELEKILLTKGARHIFDNYKEKISEALV